MTPAAASRRLPHLLAGLAALAAATAAAPGPARADGPVPGIDCKCRANGTYYRTGERACIGTADGPRTAECRMVQNVTSWAVTGEGCVVARARSAGGADAAGGRGATPRPAPPA